MADADTKEKKGRRSKGGDDDEGKRGGLLGKLLPVLVAAVAIVAAQQLGFIGGGGSEPLEEPTAMETEEMAPVPGDTVTVGELTVNLASEDLRYARIGFGLELAEGIDASALEPKYNLLKDALITIAITMSPDSLRTAEGQQDLRDQMTAKAQEIFPDGEVLRVILTDLVVQ